MSKVNVSVSGDFVVVVVAVIFRFLIALHTHRRGGGNISSFCRPVSTENTVTAA